MTCDMRKKNQIRVGVWEKDFGRTSPSSHMRAEVTKSDTLSSQQVIYLCARADFDSFAFGFCGVPSTRTIGPFVGIGCAWVVVMVVELLATASDSTFTGGTFGPSFRRPLNTLDMLTSR